MYTLDLENDQLKPAFKSAVLRSVFCSLSWIHCLSCLPAEIVNYEFDTKNLVCLVISTFVGVWYLLKKVSLTIICPSWPLTPAYEAHLPHFNELGMKQLTVSKDSCCCNAVIHSVFWRLGSAGLLNSVLSSEGSGELSCCFCGPAALDSKQLVWAGLCPERSGTAAPEQRQYRLHPAGGALRLRRFLGELMCIL